MKKKVVIIGAGFSGCTMANLLKDQFDVTIVEASDELGGGARTYFYGGHPFTYGPRHLIIDNDRPDLKEYFDKYLELREISHHSLTYVESDEKFYTYPIHLDEVKQMNDYDKIKVELENKGSPGDAQDFEEYWINSVGPSLYEKFVNNYSKKMWGIKNNKELDEFSFSPKGVALKEGSKQCFEGLKVIYYPKEKDGYNSYFDQCVDGCNLLLGTKVDRFEYDKKRVQAKGEWIEGDIIINTLSLDVVYDYCYGELRYIGRDFLKVILPIENMTPDPYHFIHYSGSESYTRVFEYKKLTYHESPNTLIVVETPSTKNKLYPYPVKSEIAIADRYKELLPKNVYTIGRAGKYRYDNMVMILKDCLELEKEIKG